MCAKVFCKFEFVFQMKTDGILLEIINKIIFIIFSYSKYSKEIKIIVNNSDKTALSVFIDTKQLSSKFTVLSFTKISIKHN